MKKGFSDIVVKALASAKVKGGVFRRKNVENCAFCKVFLDKLKENEEPEMRQVGWTNTGLTGKTYPLFGYVRFCSKKCEKKFKIMWKL